MKIRVSDATSVALGLSRGRVDAPLRTAYFMTFSTIAGGKCLADCDFCTLASSSSSSPDYLSRVRWMPFDMVDVVSALRSRLRVFRRACLQVVNYPGYFTDSVSFLSLLAHQIPISVSVMPIGRENYAKLKEMGVDKVTIPMDAATPELFSKHKGRGGLYMWERHVAALKEATAIFGRGNVCTYLIVGLGETDEEAVGFLFGFKEMGATVFLHSFTLVPGLDIVGARAPDLARYRGIQLARYLIFERGASPRDFLFKEGRLNDIPGIPDLEIITGGDQAYRTSGCPDCNRPFYNERVVGPLYNLPALREGDFR